MKRKMAISEKMTFPALLEWELLEDDYEIINPTIEQMLPGIPHKILLYRNEEYKLEAKILGKLPSPTLITNQNSSSPGEIIPSFNITGTIVRDRISYLMKGCHLGKSSINYEGLDTASPDARFETELILQQVRLIFQENKPEKWLTEWYINGVQSGFILWRSTSRRLEETFSREREVTKYKTFTSGWSESHSLDYAYIDCDDFSFILHTIPETFGPKWSNNIGIEYRDEFGGIPDREKRIAISEIVSFILGKHLLNVGYTSFDEVGNPIDKVAINPWGDNIRHLSQSANILPIQISTEAKRGTIEVDLPPLIKAYLENREILKLNEVLWRYWIGSELPLGSNIPIMANGIEILMKYWFKSRKSTSKGIYLSKDEFDRLTRDDFENIESKLEDRPFKDKIMNKLRSDYNMSLTDKLKFFFDEIELPLGELEQEAIRCRHKMIHSSVNMGETEIERIIRLSFVYRCLIHRTILKILGYSGKYIDYSVVGLTEKPLNSVAGESE